MALGTDNTQAASRFDLIIKRLPVLTNFCDMRHFVGLSQFCLRAHQFNFLFNTATQHDVGATPRHIRGDRDVSWLARLRNDFGLARMLFGVEHFVHKLGFVEHPRQQF